jgi:ABC-2 type transport system ATP-binding protein
MHHEASMDFGVYVNDVSKTFTVNKKRVEAVQGCSFFLPQGQITGFLGPNGAGKTTLIKIVAGLILPDSGNVSVHSQTSQNSHKVGAVLEGNRNIYWRLTPEENLLYFGRLRGVSGQALRPRIAQLLERFGLLEKRKAVVQTLSRGMQQKLAIAVALIHEPSVLLLDEPTLGLDFEASEILKEDLKKLAKENRAILVSTHQIDVAEQITDQTIVMNKGRILKVAKTADLIQQFSGDSYIIEVENPITDLSILTDLGCVIEDEHKVLFMGNREHLWTVLETVKPYGLISAERNKARLADIFVKLLQGEHG